MQTKGLIRAALISATMMACLCSRSVEAEGPALLDYKFEEDWSPTVVPDWSHSGHDGQRHGTSLVKGKAGKGLRFDGVDDYVECARSQRLDDMHEGTLALWVNPEAHQGGLIDRSTGPHGADQRFVLAFNTYGGKGPTFSFFWSEGVAKRYFELRTDLPPLNTWTHIAITWGRKGVRIYRNGVAVAQHGPTRAPGLAGVPLKLGYCEGLGKLYFKGGQDLQPGTHTG